MGSRKTYIVPERMHYDVFQINHRSDPIFICSCAKEIEALAIIKGMFALFTNNGAAWGDTTFKVRARPTTEHTIHSLRV